MTTIQEQANASASSSKTQTRPDSEYEYVSPPFPGDYNLTDPVAPVPRNSVIIVGAGPAGCMADLCLTTFGLKVLHIDNRPHTTEAGRADGLQPRTLEVLRNIGGVFYEEGKASLAKRMINQGVRYAYFFFCFVLSSLVATGSFRLVVLLNSVYEVAFWDPTDDKPLARTSRAPSCPDFIE